MKYIIVKEMGHEVPILFHELIQHSQAAAAYPAEKIISAGFVKFRFHSNRVDAQVYGESETLKINTRDEDGKIIEHEVYRNLI